MKKEDFADSSVEAEEAENPNNNTPVNPVMIFGIMTAVVILITVIISAVILNLNKEPEASTSDSTNTTENAASGETTIDAERAERLSLIKKNGSDFETDDTVVIGLYISDSDQLNGYIGWYIPEDQKTWKGAIKKACEEVKDKKYETFPENEMLPLTVYWRNHDGGIGDYWRLNYNGSLWGEHMVDGKSHSFKNNYIAAEDGPELATLIRQTYEYFGINPIKPEQVGDITYAEIIANGKTYTLEDRVKLGYLSDTLKNSKPITSSDCTWVKLRLTRSDGKVITLSLASDGCGIWHSDGKYYRYGDTQSARSIYSLFGIDLSRLH